MARDAIKLDNKAPDNLPFSAGVYAGETIFLSGQVGLDPQTGALVEGGVAPQTDQIFRNIAALLSAVGKTLEDIVKANVYLSTMNDYESMNEAYARGFTKPYPARTCVGVAALPLGAKVEIEVIVR